MAKHGGNQGGRPPKFTDEKQMQAAIDKYFTQCEEKKTPLTISGLAIALDMTTQSLRNYEKTSRFFGTINRAKQFVENYIEQALISGGAATGPIFWLKNNAGWRDRTETDFTSGGNPLQAVIALAAAKTTLDPHNSAGNGEN